MATDSMSGVIPRTSLSFTSAPASKRSRTVSGLREVTASNKGVRLPNNEWEAAMLAERLSECQWKDVKTTAFQVEAYPADFLTVQDLSEITPVDPADVGKVWKRGEIERLLRG